MLPARSPLRPLAVVLLAGVIALSGCATPPGGAASPVSPSPTESAEPTPEASETPGEVVESPAPTPSAADPGEQATVMFITLEVVGGTLEATGTVPDVVEEGGTCTLTLTQGNASRTVEASTATGPESTFCGLMTIPSSELASGDWQATLSYRSGARSGVSETESVTLP
jgi:hypothetical protein